MATTSTGQPLTGVDYHKNPKPNYADILKQPQPELKSIPMKPVVYLHGEPRVVWEEDEINQMIVNENLQFVVIGMFSYGLHDF